MAEQEFLNYARDDGGNVSVPRRLRTRRNAPEVELAYITPEEAGILSALKPGTPHRGPMEIPNYDSFDAAGNYTSGAAMSAAETGSRNQRDRAEVRASNIGGPRGLAPGVTSNEAQALRNSYLNARAMGQRRSGGNFFGNIARGVGSIFGGLPGTIASWASRLDPRKLRGMNPATGEPYTQDQYEQNRYNRQIQNRIDRLRKTRDTGKYANDPEGWAASDLSGRLAGFENQLGIKDYSRDTLKARDAYEPQGIEETAVYDDYNFPDQSGFISEAEYNAQPKFNFNEGPEVLPTGTQFTGNLEDYQRGLVQKVGMNQDQIDYLNKVNQMNKNVGNTGAGAFYTYETPQNVMKEIESLNPKSDKFFGGIDPDKIVVGDKSTYAQPQEVYDYINKLQPSDSYRYGKGTIGIATGGRVGYNKGGRVGILAAF